MIKAISIHDFLLFNQAVVLADVRTPAEFEQGHVPGTFNLPLFSNEERVKVGTTYKQIGRGRSYFIRFRFDGCKIVGVYPAGITNSTG